MNKYWLLLPLVGMSLTGCDTMRALERNRQAVDMSTQAICENVRAIEQANQGIEENRRRLEEINESLKNMGE